MAYREQHKTCIEITTPILSRFSGFSISISKKFLASKAQIERITIYCAVNCVFTFKGLQTQQKIIIAYHSTRLERLLEKSHRAMFKSAGQY